MNAVILANRSVDGHNSEPACLLTLCGISLVARQLRMLRKTSVDKVTIIVPKGEAERFKTLIRPGLSLFIVEEGEGRDPETRGLAVARLQPDRFILLQGEYVLDERLLHSMLGSEHDVLCVDDKPPPNTDDSRLVQCPAGRVESQSRCYFAGAACLSPQTLDSLWHAGGSPGSFSGALEQLVARGEVGLTRIGDLPTFSPELRRNLKPFWFQVLRTRDLRSARRLLIKAVQKGTQDWPAVWIHAPVEDWFIERLCETRVTPNQLTLMANVAAWFVTWLFWSGQIVSGLLGAAFVGILDGLDGKMARVKVMTSRIGKVEHFFDTLFEYSWWLALSWRLSGEGTNGWLFLVGPGIVVCHFMEIMALAFFQYFRGRHVGRILDNYTPVDARIRRFSGRRNVYIWTMLPFAMVGYPVAGLWVAFGWAVVTVVVRWYRALFNLRVPMQAARFDFVVP
jgi:phosphatidylglycerophosphate synthase